MILGSVPFRGPLDIEYNWYSGGGGWDTAVPLETNLMISASLFNKRPPYQERGYGIAVWLWDSPAMGT